MRIALALALAACSSKDKPAPPAPPIVHDAAAPDAVLDLTKPCLPSSFADANIAYLRSDGPRVTVCYGNGDDTPGSVTACLVLDEHGEVLGPRTWEDAMNARLASRELPQAVVDVEVADDVTQPGIASLDKTRAFTFEQIENTWRGRFYDLRTNKQIGDVDLSKLDVRTGAFTVPSHVREARWVGTRVIVTDRVDGGPMYQAFLISSSGDHFALGDETSSYTVVDSDLIAVASGKGVHLIDVGKVAGAKILLAPGEASPLGDMLVAKFSDQLVVAHARPAGVFFVERAKYSVTTERAIPICPR